MEKLKIEEFRAIRKKIDDITLEFKPFLDNPDLADELSEEEYKEFEQKYEVLEKEIGKIYEEIKTYDLSEIPFEEWDGFIWLFDSYDLEGTGANLDFNLIRTLGSSYNICRFKGCNIRNFDFDKIRFDDDSFDEEFKDRYEEHFFSKDITDPEVRQKYYRNNLSIEDAIVWNLEDIPIEKFSYMDRKVIEKVGLEKVKTIDLELLRALEYKLYDFLEDADLTEETDITDFIISKIEEDIKTSFWNIDTYESIPIVKEKLSEYFIDFGEPSEASEALKESYKTRYLELNQVLANYDIFRGKKYAHTLYYNSHLNKNVTEEQVEKFYNDLENIVPIFLKLRMNSDYLVEIYSRLETEEGKKDFIEESIGLALLANEGEGNLTLKDIYELSKYVSIENFVWKNDSILNKIIEAKGIEALKELENIKLEDLTPKDLETAKQIGDIIGNYDFLNTHARAFIEKYGIDNLIKLNKDSEGMIDTFIMQGKSSLLYERIHYDHEDRYKLPENATYEDFENIFVNILTETYNRRDLDYSKFRGEFSKRHPELYLPDDAPEELADKYYKRTLKLSDFKEHPEWKEYFENTRLAIGLRQKTLKVKETYNEYINIYDYFELNDRYTKEDMFNLLLPYNVVLDNIDFQFRYEISLDLSLDDLKRFLEESFYQAILERFEYSEEFPQDFKEAHSELFLSERVPKEIRDKFYSRKIEMEDFRKIDNIQEEFRGKNIRTLISPILSNKNYYSLITIVGKEKFLEYAHKYGEYMEKIVIPENISLEEIEEFIKDKITENILNCITPYGPDAPDFLRETHPELFISDDAPEELKLSFYSSYISEDTEILKRSAEKFTLRVRNLLSHPEWVDYLEGKNPVPGMGRRGQPALFRNFGAREIYEMIQIDLAAIEAVSQNSGVELLKKFLEEESKNFAYREILKTENYTEEQIKEALESEDLSNKEYEKIRNLYNNKVEKYRVEIIKNPGVFLYYPYEKIEEFNFGEYKELKALSNFSESSDYRRYMEEKLISHMYGFLGYAEAKKMLQLPEMSKEEIERLITEQKEAFDSVYEKRFKLKGNVKVLNTFFEKLDPILPTGKAKFQIYKSINQKLEEGFEGDISELIESVLVENNLKVDKEKLALCITNSEATLVSEKMSFIKDEMMKKINDNIPENAADKKIIYDNLIDSLKDSLTVHKKIDIDYIETLLKKEFSRLKEDGTTFYSPHVTEHISKMMDIIKEFNSEPYIAKVLNIDLKELLKEEKEKIGQGWIRKALTISDNLTKEQLDELQAKLYGESGYSIDTIKQIELRDKTDVGRRKAFLLLQQNDNPNLITYSKAEKMFDSFTGPYSERFRDFFLEHKEEILADPKYYTMLKKMNDNFDRIVDKPHNVNRFAAGKFSLEELEREINNIRYDGVKEGEYELEYVARLGGLDAKYFPVAQKLFEEMKQRKHQTIPQIDIARGRFRGRILRIDDPLHLMIGDITTCCQAIGTHAGEGSMVHSAVERNGSVFVVEEYDEYGNYVGPVAQSWTWRNGDRICFDNVEIPDTLETDLKGRNAHEEIFRIYQEAAKMIIANDKKAMKKLLDAGKITREQYDTLIAKEVTMGIGCDDLIKNLSVDTKKQLKMAKIVKPVEANKGYDAVQKGKRPWIDSGGTQYVIAEMDPEERKELSPKGKVNIEEIPLQYTRTREVISRKGYGIHEDICRTLKDMKLRETDEESFVVKNNVSEVAQVAYEYGTRDIDKVHLSMNTNEDWFILSVDTDDVIRVVDTAIVEGKGSEIQKEYDKKLAQEEFDKAMEQLLLEATDSGKKFVCEITDNPKFDIFRKLSEEKIISIGEDGVITLEDREKLRERIDQTRESIEIGTVERNIADSTKSDSDGR